MKQTTVQPSKTININGYELAIDSLSPKDKIFPMDDGHELRISMHCSLPKFDVISIPKEDAYYPVGSLRVRVKHNDGYFHPQYEPTWFDIFNDFIFGWAFNKFKVKNRRVFIQTLPMMDPNASVSWEMPNDVDNTIMEYSINGGKDWITTDGNASVLETVKKQLEFDSEVAYQKAKADGLAYQYNYEFDLDEYDTAMPVEEFREGVKSGMYTDYDGHGYPSIGRRANRKHRIYPSTVGDIPKSATHICWFNK